MALVTTLWALSGVAAARVLTMRPRRRHDEPITIGDPFVALRLRSRDGLEIGAWLAEHEDETAAVVLVHGHGAERSELRDEALTLWNAGATVMPITVRAHGDSEGEVDDLGWSARADVEAAVARLERDRPGRRIVVMGYSLGAAAALYAAGSLGHRVAGYVLVAPYATLEEATRHRTRRMLPRGVEWLAYEALQLGARVWLPDLDRMHPIDAAASVDVPALLIAGELDDRAPEEEVRRIASRIRDARVLVAPNLGHDQLGLLVHTRTWTEIERFVAGQATR